MICKYHAPRYFLLWHKKGTFGKRHLETVTQTMKVDTNDVTCVIKKKALK